MQFSCRFFFQCHNDRPQIKPHDPAALLTTPPCAPKPCVSLVGDKTRRLRSAPDTRGVPISVAMRYIPSPISAQAKTVNLQLTHVKGLARTHVRACPGTRNAQSNTPPFLFNSPPPPPKSAPSSPFPCDTPSGRHLRTAMSCPSTALHTVQCIRAQVRRLLLLLLSCSSGCGCCFLRLRTTPHQRACVRAYAPKEVRLQPHRI